MSTLKVNSIEGATGGEVDINATLGSIPSLVITGVTTVSAGTTSAPAITPSGDSNTGIFFPSADTIAFAEGGVEALRIDSSGRLGIGTVPPTGYSAKLTVASNAVSSGGGSADGGIVLTSTTSLSTGQYAPAISFSPNPAAPWRSRAGIAAVSNDATNGMDLVFLTRFAADGTELTLSTNEKLRITSGGNVGIGSTIPQHKLDCTSIGRFTGSTNSAVSGSGAEVGFDVANSLGFIQSYNRSSSSYLNTAVSGANVLFSISGTERARIDSSGRLGIGTDNPTQKLQINDFSATTVTPLVLRNYATGSGNTKVRIALQGLTASGQGAVAIIQSISGTDAGGSNANNDSGLQFIVTNSGAGTENIAMTVNTNGNVGVGTTGPTAKLEVNGNSTFNGSFTLRSNNTVRGYFGDVDSDTNIQVRAENALTFKAGGNTERARITSGGYFKASYDGTYVNTTGSWHEFSGNSANSYDFRVRNRNSTPLSEYILELMFSASTPNDGNARFIDARDATAQRFYVLSNGGIGNYSANNSNLSDINTKKDISIASGTWDCVKEWEIVNYRYKDQPDDADLNLGVIAQQVAESCPEVITVFQEAKEATETEPAQEERLGVKEQQMYWMAIKALQEAQVRIEQLEAKVAALEAK